MDMEFVVEDKTVESAIEKGLREKGWTLSEVEVEVLDQGKKGLFRGRPARVRLKKKDSPATSLASPEGEETQDEALQSGTSLNTTDVAWKNGRLWIAPACFQKTLTLIPPEDGGLYVNEELIHKPTTIQADDEITEFLPEREIEQWIDIHTTDHDLRAGIVLKDKVKYRWIPQLWEFTEDIEIRFTKHPREQVPFSVTDIYEYVRQRGIVYGLDHQAISDWSSAAQKDRPMVIAQGKQKQDGTPTRFIPLYHEQTQEREQHRPDDAIDWFALQNVQSVQAGQQIMEILPATKGQHGTSVYGKPIIAQDGQAITPRLGQGVTLSDDGRYVLADIDGRPEWRQPRISVNPLHVVQGDLDLETGSIQFNGDVLVSGDVLEGLSIHATGSVEVRGSVMNGNIKAGGHVTVGKNIIGSEVISGGEAADYALLVDQAERILKNLQSMEQAYQQLLNSTASKAHHSSKTNVGQFVKVIMENKFPTFEKEIKQFQAGYQQGPLHVDSLRTWAELLVHKLTGYGPLSLKSMHEIHELRQMGEKVSTELHEHTQQPYHIFAYYVHNATIKASGNIQVEGLGAYNAELFAGEKIVVFGKTGVVRGGSLQSGSVIAVKELGGPSDVKTNIDVQSPQGTVSADLVYAGVLIHIQGVTHHVHDSDRHVRYKYDSDSNRIVTLHD